MALSNMILVLYQMTLNRSTESVSSKEGISSNLSPEASLSMGRPTKNSKKEKFNNLSSNMKEIFSH